MAKVDLRFIGWPASRANSFFNDSHLLKDGAFLFLQMAEVDGNAPPLHLVEHLGKGHLDVVEVLLQIHSRLVRQELIKLPSAHCGIVCIQRRVVDGPLKAFVDELNLCVYQFLESPLTVSLLPFLARVLFCQDGYFLRIKIRAECFVDEVRSGLRDNATVSSVFFGGTFPKTSSNSGVSRLNRALVVSFKPCHQIVLVEEPRLHGGIPNRSCLRYVNT